MGTPAAGTDNWGQDWLSSVFMLLWHIRMSVLMHAISVMWLWHYQVHHDAIFLTLKQVSELLALALLWFCHNFFFFVTVLQNCDHISVITALISWILVTFLKFLKHAPKIQDDPMMTCYYQNSPWLTIKLCHDRATAESPECMTRSPTMLGVRAEK